MTDRPEGLSAEERVVRLRQDGQFIETTLIRSGGERYEASIAALDRIRTFLIEEQLRLDAARDSRPVEADHPFHDEQAFIDGSVEGSPVDHDGKRRDGLRDALDLLIVGGPVDVNRYTDDPTYHAVVDVWRRAPNRDSRPRLRKAARVAAEYRRLSTDQSASTEAE